MKEFFIGSLIGAVAGMCIGGVVVSKNKKLSCRINETISNIEKKVAKAKDELQQKIEDCKESNSQNNCCC